MLPVSVYSIHLFHLIIVSRSPFCVFLSLLLCVAIRCPYPCLHAWAVFCRYRAASLAYDSLLSEERFFCLSFFLCFLFLADLFLFFVSYVSLPAWRRCPLLATSSLYAVFCLCSLLFFSERILPGLVWFDSVYIVTTAGFVADQLIM